MHTTAGTQTQNITEFLQTQEWHVTNYAPASPPAVAEGRLCSTDKLHCTSCMQQGTNEALTKKDAAHMNAWCPVYGALDGSPALRRVNPALSVRTACCQKRFLTLGGCVRKQGISEHVLFDSLPLVLAPLFKLTKI